MPVATVTTCPYLLQETGFHILTEAGGSLLVEQGCVTVTMPVPSTAPMLDGRNTYVWDTKKRRWVRQYPEGWQLPNQPTQ